MKRAQGGRMLTVLLCALLSACATSGTRVTTTSDAYKAMARSQQAWCSQFGCDCSIDDQKTTCSLVATCLNMGGCQKSAP